MEKSEELMVYWHPHCQEHDISDHPECPGRAISILETLRSKFDASVFKEANSVEDNIITLFHTERHLQTLKKMFSASEYSKSRGLSGAETYRSIDGDTKVMPSTRNAVYRAAGSVIDAIDEVFGPSPCRYGH
jgi:acetoin utilization deacetylase AcuC-like enzyme